MEDLGLVRLYVLRAMYLLIAVGLGLTAVPEIIGSSGETSDSHTVVNAMLTGFCLMALLGIRYPITMLPILLFELVWKSIWLFAIALPMYLNQQMDQYTQDVMFACAIGIILTPLAIPWRYVVNRYVIAKGDAWL